MKAGAERHRKGGQTPRERLDVAREKNARARLSELRKKRSNADAKGD